MQTGRYHLTERPSPLCMWAKQWTREADQASKLPYRNMMPFPGWKKQQITGHEGPNPPRGQNRVFALKCKELAAERTGARHQVGLPKLVPRGGETGKSCGAGGSRAGGCPHCRLRDNHTRPSPPHPFLPLPPNRAKSCTDKPPGLEQRRGMVSRVWGQAPSCPL